MQNHVKSLILILLILSIFTGNAGADTLYLKNGRAIEGIIKTEDNDSVDLEVFGGMVRFKKSEIERIERASPEASEAIRRKWEKKRVETITKAKEEQVRREFEPKQVEISQVSGHIFVEVVLNKKVNVSLILDTGASYMVLSSNVAKKLGLNLNDKEVQDVVLILADGRKVSAKRVTLESVTTQGVEAKNVTAAILPEDADDTSLKDGLLGMSFLKNFNFKVDQKNSKLILEKI